ncbi:hypothetical protein [Brevundimonas sp.]|uniref:hypothetical protein n=1 Tax=Brevundimonas sp. TaxID=1871086 RepID=UPI003D6CE923
MDTIGGELNLTAGLTLKASVGAKLGDRTLVSLFAGPSVVLADVKTTQAWAYDTLYTYLPPGGMHFQYVSNAFSESVSASRSETLVGGVFGAEGRYRLTDWVTFRAQASVRRYSPIDVAINAGGGDTRLSMEPQTVSGGFGVLYRF